MARNATARRSSSTSTPDHYQAVTDRIVAALEAGTAPWRRPWVAGARTTMPGMPCNAVSGRAYRGVNAVLLAMTQYAHGSDDPRWITYRQAAERGWQVRAGERGTPIVFFKRLDVHERPEGGEGEATVRRVPLLRGFTAFHASQVEGIALYQPPTLDEAPWRKPEAPELIVARSGVRVRTGGDQAFYSPTLDFIAMPVASSFRSPEAYAATLLHGTAHASGHERRLNRDLSGRFGSRAYSFGELIAELTSCMVGTVLGLPCEMENHASYVQSWLGVLKEDKRAVFRAAAAAQKAADWMLVLHPDFARAVASADDRQDDEASSLAESTVSEGVS
ncbi:MAG TPA: zincin-like metallopeptidase domain-containing protein [Acetobacteraceae bacterium]